MKRIIFLLMILPPVLFAGKGSTYSRYGIGEINPFIDGRYAGMGGNGVALSDESYINILNPAALSTINRTLLSASYRFQNLNSSDATGSSVLTLGNIGAIALAFPIYHPKLITAAISVVPFSSVGYEQQLLTTPYNAYETFDGRGGVSLGQLSASYAPVQSIRLGLSFQYLFGAIYSDQRITFTDASFYGGSYHQTTSVRGLAATIGGTIVGFDKMIGLSEQSNWDVGATVFTGSKSSFDEETIKTFSSNNDTVTSNNLSMDIPAGIALGVVFRSGLTSFLSDVRFENWGNYSVEGIHPSEFQNSMRFGLGIEVEPVKDFRESFWDKVAYRFGGYVKQTNLYLNGQSINEIFGSAGISFPVSASAVAHVAAQYGIRGTTSSSLVKDTILRLTFSLTASELMFIQSPVE